MKSNILSTSPNNTRAFDTSIASALGDINAAVIVQQLHYWSLKEGVGTVINGVKYIYNTFAEWVKQFPWLSIWQFRSAMKLLRELGIVKVIRYKAREWNQTNYYWLDLDRLFEYVANPAYSDRAEPGKSDLAEPGRSDRETALRDRQNSLTQEEIEDSVTSEKEKSNSTPAATPTKPVTEVKTINPKWKELIEELDSMGVPINKTIVSLVKMYSESEVGRAIALLKLRKREQQIPNPGGYFTAALKENWANAVNINTTENPEQVSGTEVFRLWYDLAKELGYCSSQEIREGEQWVLMTGTWEKWSSAISRGYSLEYLQKIMKKNKST